MATPIVDMANEKHDEEQRSLLYGDSILPRKHAVGSWSHLWKTHMWKFAAFLQSFVILALVFSLTTNPTKFFGRTSSSQPLYVPFRSAMQYHIETPPEDHWSGLLYVLPSYESDKAWNDLLINQTVRIHDDEVEQLNMSHLELSPVEGGGYATLLGVFHNLHCLRRIRQILFREYYYPNETPEQVANYNGHAYHCLEALRSSLMCNADTTLFPLMTSEARPSFAVPNVPQKCVDWDALMATIEDKHFQTKDFLPKHLLDRIQADH